ncbi:MAG: hypothetical protein IJY62_03885 [Clostridia bacterium]|nr:hypothetical protein [Clostridia bacterium]
MSELIKKFKGSDLPVAVYYKTGGAFCAGFIREADDEFICMEFLSPSGRHDGWHCIRLEEILKMDFSTAYLKDLARVYRYYNEKVVAPKISPKNVLTSFIDVAIKQKWLCTMEVGFESLQKISGYPVARDWNTIEMKLIDESGEDDGYTSFELEEIVYVGAQSELEQYLLLLRELNKTDSVEPKRNKEKAKKNENDSTVLSFPHGK